MTNPSKFAHLQLVKICYADGGHLLCHKDHAWEYLGDLDATGMDTRPSDEEIVQWLRDMERPLSAERSAK